MFQEIGDRVFVARYRAWDVNVGLVLGRGRAALIDSRGGVRQARQVLDDVRRLAPGVRVSHVVNTHVHFDHALGNAAFVGALVLAHEQVRLGLAGATARVRAEIRADYADCPEHGYTTADLDDVLGSPVRGPDLAVTEVGTLALGGREVVVRHTGRGHTDGDLAVAVPDADVVFLGDLVEQSGPPSAGPDAFPAQWPDTLDRHLAHIGPQTVVVPGHGTPVDRAFVVAQRDLLRRRLG